MKPKKKRNQRKLIKPKLSRNIKIYWAGNRFRKSTESGWNKIKATKKKLKPAIKEAIVTKVPTLKDKELKLNADLSKKSVTVSAKDFEGEITLKFEIEAKSVDKTKA